MSIRSLGYVGLTVKNPDAFGAFATGVLGLMPGAPAGAARRLRMDEHAWRIQIDRGEADDVSLVGFEVAGLAELEAMVAHLRAAGVEVTEGDPDRLADRGVLGLAACRDPEGLAVEFFYGPTLRMEQPFVSPSGVSSFVTGGMGLGHVALTTRDIGAARRFYRDLLGFRLTDIIHLPVTPKLALDVEFYHCNRRHHTVALAPAPTPRRLQHIMVQVPTLDDVGYALERAEAARSPIAQGIGRHSNDRMVSFYVRSPAAFEFEFGFGAVEVDDATWQVTRHDAGSSWGHKRVRAEPA